MGLAGMTGCERDTVPIVVTDAEGRIVLADQADNYRVRPGPDTALTVLGGDVASPQPLAVRDAPKASVR